MNTMETNQFNILSYFPSEEQCKETFRQYRTKNGVVCKTCGCKKHYWIKSIGKFQCAECGHRTTLKSGTIMEDSKISFRHWFIAMHLITSTKHSISASELMRRLERNSYQPVWELLHKLRSVMGKRDNEYMLDKDAEVDEAFFSTMVLEEEKNKPTKRGAGSQKKTKVLVMAESEEVKNPRNPNKPKEFGYVKMLVINNLKKKTINPLVKENISADATITSDATKSHSDFKEIFAKHISKVVDPKDIGKVLPWVHICISNAKSVIADYFHGVKDSFLQYYLNEFAWKCNRRNFDADGLMDRLLNICTIIQSDFKHIIYWKKKALPSVA